MRSMDDATKRALVAIDRVCERPVEYGPFVVPSELLDLVARVETMPRIAPRTEKGFVDRLYREEIDFYRRVRRVEP